MSSMDDFNTLKPVLAGIPAEEVHSPVMPVHIMAQEAENLYHWALQDRDALVNVGMDPAVIGNIAPAAGALRFAEGEWYKMRYSRDDVQKQWNEESPQAFELRDRLLHDFLFAFRNDENLLQRVRGISEGSGNADMIQDLVKLRAIGLENAGPLEKIHFDASLLDRAAETADRMSDLLGAVNTELPEESGARDLRDRAFTHLKKLVTEVREYGKYVFYRNDERYRGYVSSYFRRINRANGKAGKAEPAEAPATA